MEDCYMKTKSISGETFDNSEDGGHAIEVDGQDNMRWMRPVRRISSIA
jgi:hypothetical protein